MKWTDRLWIFLWLSVLAIGIIAPIVYHVVKFIAWYRIAFGDF